MNLKVASQKLKGRKEFFLILISLYIYENWIYKDSLSVDNGRWKKTNAKQKGKKANATRRRPTKWHKQKKIGGILGNQEIWPILMKSHQILINSIPLVKENNFSMIC